MNELTQFIQTLEMVSTNKKLIKIIEINTKFIFIIILKSNKTTAHK